MPFGPEAPGSIRRRRRPGFHQPPGLSADARRVLVPFTARIRLGRESRHGPDKASRRLVDPSRLHGLGARGSVAAKDVAIDEPAENARRDAAEHAPRLPADKPDDQPRRDEGTEGDAHLAKRRHRPSPPRSGWWTRSSSDVAILRVTPAEALARGHLEDDRVVLAERVGSAVAGLRLAAADV